MTREEHLEWCKKRAREYLDRGDVKNGVTSMLSDLTKHEETQFGGGGMLMVLGMQTIMSGDLQAARRFIEGFN